MSNLVLKVGGQRYWGWKEITVNRGIEQMAGSFELLASDRWAIGKAASPIQPGQECAIEIDGFTVITGYIDEVEPSHDAGNHELVIRGRDRSADLVDCVAESDGREWNGRTLTQIATDLCKPFGINVIAQADVGDAFKVGRIEPDETVFETLSRAARQRGVLLMADGRGSLVITTAGTAVAGTPLILGKNILSGSGLNSQRERFGRYIVRAQSDETAASAEAAQQRLAVATDPQIRSTRVTAVHAWDQMNTAQAQQLASWTAHTRIGRGQRATETVRGWLDRDGPWQPNTLVDVDDAYTRTSGRRLIAQVSHTLDPERGERTAITVVPPPAFDLLAEPEPAENEGGGL